MNFKAWNLLFVLVMIPLLAIAEVEGNGNGKDNGQGGDPKGGSNGSGGAGVKVNGIPQTFYSAGLYTEPNPGTTTDIPGMGDLIKFVNTFSQISTITRVKIMQAIQPSRSHQYYKVVGETFTPEVRNRILNVYYREVLKIDPNDPRAPRRDDLVLLAVTDTSAGTTFLLPDFYRLQTTAEQMAILFHEGFWMMNPDSTYGVVVGAEGSFQALVEQPNDQKRVMNFLNYIGTSEDKLTFAVNFDVKNNALKGLADKYNKIPITSLLSRDYFTCIDRQNRAGEGNCDMYAMNQLYDLQSKFPNSLILELLRDSISTKDRDGTCPSAITGYTATEQGSYINDREDRRYYKDHNLCNGLDSPKLRWQSFSFAKGVGTMGQTGAVEHFLDVDTCKVSMAVKPNFAASEKGVGNMPMSECRGGNSGTELYLSIK